MLQKTILGEEISSNRVSLFVIIYSLRATLHRNYPDLLDTNDAMPKELTDNPRKSCSVAS